MARGSNFCCRSRALKKSSGIERPNKGGFRSGRVFADSPQSQTDALELDLPSTCEGPRRAHRMRHQEHPRFWSFWLERILPKKRSRDSRPVNAKVRPLLTYIRNNPGRSILVSAGQDCESIILADYQDSNPQSWLLDPGGQDFLPARIVPHNPGRLPEDCPSFLVL